MWDLIVSVPDHCLSFYFVSSKIYDKRDDFDFDIVNFPFFVWWRSPFYLLRGLYFSTYSVC